MGRMLSPEDFALFSAIMALFMLLSSPVGAISLIVSRMVSSICVRGQYGFLRVLYWRMHFHILIVAVILFVGLLFVGHNVQEYLHASSQEPVWLFAALLALGAFVLINNAFIQGTQRFGWLAGTNVLYAVLKIAFSVLLVLAGFAVSGAVAGVTLAAVAVWLLGLWLIVPGLPNELKPEVADVGFSMQAVFPVLIANIAFAAMTQLDMLLVNWYFPQGQAGLYAAASVLGKAVLYMPGGLVMALYPIVAENHAKDQSSAHIMLQAVFVTAALCGMAALVYWWGGEWLIALFYGKSYAGAGELLSWYGFAILPMGLVMVAEYFLIAKGRILFAWLFLGMAPLQVFAIHLWHDQLWMVIAIMGGCGSFLVVIGYGMLWREYQGLKTCRCI